MSVVRHHRRAAEGERADVGEARLERALEGILAARGGRDGLRRAMLDVARDLGDDAAEALYDALGAEGLGRLGAPTWAPQAARDLAADIAADARAARREGDDAAPAWASAALDLLGEALGAAREVASAEARLETICDPDAARAERSASLARGLAAELGLSALPTLHVDGEAAGRTRSAGAAGLFEDGVIYLDPAVYAAAGADDEALLAHELVHAAQARLSGGQADGAGLAAAEVEAYGVMQDVRAGRGASPATVPLDAGALAACGPRQMQEEADEETGGPEPEPGPIPIPDPDPDPGPDPDPDTKLPGPDETKKKTEPPGGTAAPPAADCEGGCPEPLPEHAEARPKAPALAPTGAGKVVKLDVAGHKVQIRLPEAAQKGRVSVALRKSDSPFEALRLHAAVLELDEELRVTGGAIRCSVALGKFVRAEAVSLAIRRDGSVAAQIRGAKVAVGSVLRGTVDLDIDEGGVSGHGTFRASAFRLAPDLRCKEGYLDVVVARSGAVTAHGRVKVQVADLCTGTFDVCFIDGKVRAHAELDWDKPVPIAPGVVLERAHLTGCSREDGSMSLTGDADLGLLKAFGGHVDVACDIRGKSRTWEVAGRITQRSPVVLGGLTLENTSLAAAWKRDHWEPAEAHAEVLWRGARGTVDGLYDIAERELSARGELHLEDPLPLGKTGMTLASARVEALIERNELMTLSGGATLVIMRDAVPTFSAEVDAHVVVATGDVDAEGAVSVLRDVPIGRPAGLHGVLLQGGRGQFAMKANAITALGARMPFAVRRGEAEVGAGFLTLTGADATRLDGELRFGLTGRTGVPNAATGPLFMLPGGELSALIEGGSLGVVEVAALAFEAPRPGGGRVTGTLDGRLDLTGKAPRFDGKGTCGVAAGDVSIPLLGGYQLALAEGTGLSVTVTNNALGALEGRLQGAVHDASGVALLAVAGRGGYDLATGALTGLDASASLVSVVKLGALELRELEGAVTVSDKGALEATGALTGALPTLANTEVWIDGGLALGAGGLVGWGSGGLSFVAIDDPETGRHLSGELSASFERDGSWRADGAVAFALTSFLETTAHVAVDDALDPVVDATFDLKDRELLAGRELFALNFPLFKLSAGIISGGLSGGIALSMKDLLFTLGLDLIGWRPFAKGDEAALPEVDAELKLRWGLDFKARVAAYLMLGLDLIAASLGAGVEGGAELDVPLDVTPTGRLHLGPKGVSGEVDVQLAIDATLELFVKPFVKASFLWWDWRKDWPLKEKIPVFSWRWGKRYGFGDDPGAPRDIAPGAPMADKGATSQRHRVTQSAEAAQAELFPERRAAAAPPRPGAPALDPAVDAKGDAPREQEGFPGGLGKELERYQPIIDAIAALGELFQVAEPVIDLLGQGVAGWLLAIFRIAFDGNPSWEALSEAAHKVQAKARAAWAAFQAEVTDFKTRFMLDKLLGDKPSLLDALFGDDDAVRAEVLAGTHEQLDERGLAEFINVLQGGSCGDEDEAAILRLLDTAARKGLLGEVLARVDGGVRSLLHNLDGAENTQLRAFLRAHRVDH